MQGDPVYTPIRVTTLRGDNPTAFDIYVKVGDRYVLYLRQGSTFEGSRLERLKSKRLRHMFVREEDDIAYRQYLEQSIDQAYSKKGGKDLAVRAEIIQGFQQAAAEEMMENLENEDIYNHTRSSLQRFVGFINEEKNAIHALLSIRNIDKSISHHGVNVATLFTALAIHEGIRDDNLVELTAFGALVHDVEHFLGGYEVPTKLSTLSPDQFSVYRQHPIDGGRRLQKIRHIDQVVFKTISQHEEHCDGTGFPKGIHEKQMDPLVPLVGVANAYDRLTALEEVEPKAALKRLLIEKLGAFPLKHLQGLQAVLKNQNLV